MIIPMMLEPWHWLAAGFALLILEMLLPTGFVLLWVGAGALVVALLSWIIPGMGLGLECALWGASSLAAILLWRRWRPAPQPTKDEPTLNRRAHSYVGRVFTLAEPIVNGVGRVRVDDSQWRIVGEDLPAGAQVSVIAVDGTTLRVRQATANA